MSAIELIKKKTSIEKKVPYSANICTKLLALSHHATVIPSSKITYFSSPFSTHSKSNCYLLCYLANKEIEPKEEFNTLLQYAFLINKKMLF